MMVYVGEFVQMSQIPLAQVSLAASSRCSLMGLHKHWKPVGCNMPVPFVEIGPQVDFEELQYAFPFRNSIYSSGYHSCTFVEPTLAAAGAHRILIR